MTHTEHSHDDASNTSSAAHTETHAHDAHTHAAHEHSATDASTEHDFSVPKDADFTTPGDPMTEPGHRDTADEDGQGSLNATPGNPLGEEH